MQPDVFQLIGYGSLILLLLYAGFFVWRRRAGPAGGKLPTDVIEANTQAIRENSELLRELISLNRGLLEQQDRSDR